MIDFKHLCVFCGSNPGTDPAYMEAAAKTGAYLAGSGIGLVFGGGRVGMMGRVADTVMENGGEVIGIIPKDLADKEVAHKNLTELHIVGSMHERKRMMAKTSDGFIAMPGGFGTFEEICEMITWSQLGFQSKPCGILNVNGYYDDLVALFSNAVDKGFVRPGHIEIVIVRNEIEELVAAMKEFERPDIEKWLDKDSI
jgi:uncharacterized protein (TIGR00730 family)